MYLETLAKPPNNLDADDKRTLELFSHLKLIDVLMDKKLKINLLLLYSYEKKECWKLLETILQRL